MSLYCFMACDKKVPPLSIGIDDQGYRIIIPDERHILNIYEAAQDNCTRPFTDKQVIMGVEIGLDFLTVAEDMLSYVQKAMLDNANIELWSIWIGTVDIGDRKVEKKSVSIGELTTDDLGWVLDDMNYSHPKCLKIYKWMKGK